VVLYVPVKIWFRFSGRNTHYIPKKGAAILTSNHVSFLDHYITPGIVSRQIKYLAKAEYFEKPVSRWLYTNWGQIPLERGKGDSDALRHAKKHLRNGGLLGIYPEGTRSTDGYIHEGRTGVARLALETGTPIIPVGMLGTFKSMPKNQHYAKPCKITVVFGPPIKVKGLKGREDDRELCRALTDEIMFEIEKLTKPDHVIEPKVRKSMVKRRKEKPFKDFVKEAMK
jgi:1-acyl-sn-glycerol-3-phosphate acyltransferase